MKVIAIICVLIVSMFLIGCSNVDTLEEEKGVIKIGLQMPLTGDISIYGNPLKDAAQMAVDEVNAEGGIDGRIVELVVEDSLCDSKIASTVAAKMISVDNVVAIVGDFCSSATLAAAPIAENGKTVLMSPSSTNPAIKESGDYIFRNVASDDYQGKEAAMLAEKLELKTIGILHENTDYGIGLKTVFKESFSGEVVIEETYEQQKDKDYRTQLTKIKAADVDGLYIVGGGMLAVQMFKQIKELGIDAQLLGAEALADPSLGETTGGTVAGLLVVRPKVNDDENYEAFIENYKSLYGEPSIYTLEGYDAVKVILKAVEMSDGSREGVKEALYNIGKYCGASGCFEFDEYGEVSREFEVVEFDANSVMSLWEG